MATEVVGNARALNEYFLIMQIAKDTQTWLYLPIILDANLQTCNSYATIGY
jgi:hypothetical protein